MRRFPPLSGVKTYLRPINERLSADAEGSVAAGQWGADRDVVGKVSA